MWTCRIEYDNMHINIYWYNFHQPIHLDMLVSIFIAYFCVYSVFIDFSSYVYSQLHTLHSPQDGDSAVIMATQHHHSEVLKVLVASGVNLNLQNQVTLI